MKTLKTKKPIRHGKRAKRKPSDESASGGRVARKGQKGVSDMRNYKNYIKREPESKVLTFVIALIVLGLLVFTVLTLTGMFDEPLWKPDISYPMVNTHVSWMQTWYGGAF